MAVSLVPDFKPPGGPGTPIMAGLPGKNIMRPQPPIPFMVS